MFSSPFVTWMKAREVGDDATAEAGDARPSATVDTDKQVDEESKDPVASQHEVDPGSKTPAASRPGSVTSAAFAAAAAAGDSGDDEGQAGSSEDVAEGNEQATAVTGDAAVGDDGPQGASEKEQDRRSDNTSQHEDAN